MKKLLLPHEKIVRNQLIGKVVILHISEVKEKMIFRINSKEIKVCTVIILHIFLNCPLFNKTNACNCPLCIVIVKLIPNKNKHTEENLRKMNIPILLLI